MVLGVRVIKLVLVANVAVASGLAMASSADGPIKSPSSSRALSFDVAESSQAWDGDVFVRNDGRKVAILDSVRLVGRSATLRFLGAYTHVKKTPSDPSFAADRGWPPNTFARPYRRLRGTRVPPASTQPEGMQDVQVIIRVRVPVRHTMVGYHAVDIRYHVGRHHYRARFHSAFTLCVRPPRTHVDCKVR